MPQDPSDEPASALLERIRAERAAQAGVKTAGAQGEGERMNAETQFQDNKSLRLLQGGKAGWVALAADCVCFANAAGGVLRIGIEDGACAPPAHQRIEQAMLDTLRKRLGELTVNVLLAPGGCWPQWGRIHRAARGALGGCGIDQRRALFLRVGDACRPVVGDDVLHLLSDRSSMPWETMLPAAAPRPRWMRPKARPCWRRCASERVKPDVKEKTDTELLVHYGLLDGERLTHLGVLMLGSAMDRARLGSAPIVQAVKFDELGQKIAKWSWDDYRLSCRAARCGVERDCRLSREL